MSDEATTLEFPESLYMKEQLTLEEFDQLLQYAEQATIESQDIEADYRLGVAYSGGEAGRSDLHEALYWFRRSALGGHVSGMCNTAICLILLLKEEDSDLNLDDSIFEALEWLEKASNRYQAPTADYMLFQLLTQYPESIHIRLLPDGYAEEKLARAAFAMHPQAMVTYGMLLIQLAAQDGEPSAEILHEGITHTVTQHPDIFSIIKTPT